MLLVTLKYLAKQLCGLDTQLQYNVERGIFSKPSFFFFMFNNISRISQINECNQESGKKMVCYEHNFRLANPAARISWLINGQTVQSVSHSYLEQTTGIITISNLTVSSTDIDVITHQINVQCIAMNDEGTKSKQLVIRILCMICFSLDCY